LEADLFAYAWLISPLTITTVESFSVRKSFKLLASISCQLLLLRTLGVSTVRC